MGKMLIDEYKIIEINSVPIKDILQRLNIKIKNNKFICPFHNDNTPSANIYKSKNRFKCFSCGTYGSNIDLVMKVMNLSFIKACEFITGEKYRTSKKIEISYKSVSIYETIKMKLNEILMKNNIIKDQIFNMYGFTSEIIQNEMIGFFPKNFDLFSFLKTKFSETDILKTGFFYENHNPVFSDRVIFWINSFYAVGRTIYSDEKKKYLNQLKDTNFKFVKTIEYMLTFDNTIKNPNDKNLYITEGEADAITLRSYNKNAICLTGIRTDIPSNIYKFLKTISKKFKVILCYDFDPDDNGNDRLADIKNKSLFSFSTIIYTYMIQYEKTNNKEDVNSFIRSHSIEEFNKLKLISVEDIISLNPLDYIDEIWKLRTNTLLYRNILHTLLNGSEELKEEFIFKLREYLFRTYTRKNIPFPYIIIDNKTLDGKIISESSFISKGIIPEKYLISNQEIFISSKVLNVEDNTEGLEITYKYDSNLRNLVVKRSFTDIGKTETEHLINKGIKISSKTKSNLSHYFDSFNEEDLPQKLVTNRLGWVKNKNAFMLDECIGDDITHEETYDELSAVGNFEDWKHIFDSSILYNKEIALAVGTAFATPLLEKLNLSNFVLHFSGESSKGKTTLLRLCASIYGNPGMGLNTSKSYMHSWNGTSNSIMHIASTYKDIPFLIDELTLSSEKNESIRECIYNYVNGSDKTRLTKNAALRDRKFFRGSIISTGENPLIENDDTAKKGEIIRIIDFPIDDVFNITPIANKHLFIKHLEEVILKNYGHASKIYIEKLIQFIDENPLELSNLYKKYYEKISNLFKDLHVRRIQYFASSLIGIELMHKFLDLSVDLNEIQSAIISGIHIDTKRINDVVNVSESQKIYSYLISKIISHKDRFPDFETSKDLLKCDLWGSIEKKGMDRYYVRLMKTSLKEVFKGTQWTSNTINIKLCSKYKTSRCIILKDLQIRSMAYIIDLPINIKKRMEDDED